MREIKFRGMDLQGRWHYGLLTILAQDLDAIRKAGCYISNSSGLPFAYSVRPETIGQFTGLKDKNGKEIYEGDIVSFKGNSIINAILGEPLKDRVSQIIWNEEKLAFTLSSGTSLSKKIDNNNLEVIGNIYENPELLK